MRTFRRKTPNSPPSFAIVVDGKTEVWYLQMLKRNEKEIRVSIKPEIPNKKSTEEQYNLVCELANKEFSGLLISILLLKKRMKFQKGKNLHYKYSKNIENLYQMNSRT